MANGDTTVSRLGQDNLSGSALALFLKVFSGEVMATFEETNVMRQLIERRTIPYGKSATFPVLGRASAFYHTAGKNIADAGNSLLSTIAASERVINVDNKLISAVSVNEVDELMNHYDIRGPYSTELGRAVSKRYDQLGLNTMVLAARASATITGLNGGATVTSATMGTSGPSLQSALFTAAQKLDEKDVPKEDRFAVISPAMFYNLIRDPSTTSIATANGSAITTSGYPLLSRDLEGANGSFSGARLREVAGFTILVSNHIPVTNIASNDAFFGTTAASANGNVYYGDFSKTLGVAFHRSAIGVVQLRDIALEAEYKIEYQGTLMVAKMVTGMGILRPECAIELATP